MVTLVDARVRRPRFVVIDQSLRGAQGHHYSYAWTVAEAARSLDHESIIVANKGVDGEVRRDSEARSLSIRPWFSESWTESLAGSVGSPLWLQRAREHVAAGLRSRPALYGAAGRLYGAMRKRRLVGAQRSRRPLGRFHAEFASLLHSLDLTSQDHVFIPTLSTLEASDCFHVLAGEPIVRARIHLLFRRDPSERAILYSSAGSLASLLRSIQDSPLHRQALRFYTDTPDLSAAYSRMSSFHFETVPIPVRPLPAAGPRERREEIRITYFGDARTEKGFHLLPRLVKAVVGSPLADRVKFVVQANRARAERDEGGIGAARDALRPYVGPRLELIEDALSEDEYSRRLLETDAIVIPYQPFPYRYRSSGILAEALVAGKPVIVPCDTWMAREADEGSSVKFRGAGELFPAVSKLVSNFPKLRDIALERMSYWRNHHHPLAVVQTLVSSAPVSSGHGAL